MGWRAMLELLQEGKLYFEVNTPAFSPKTAKRRLQDDGRP